MPVEHALFSRDHRPPAPANAELVLLPEHVERRLEVPNGPVDAMEASFRAAGIPMEAIAEYRAAVRSFLRERPSEIIAGGRELNYEPVLEYFGLRMRFPADIGRVEDVLRAEKPRLGSGNTIEARADSRRLLDAFLANDASGRRTETKPAFELFLGRLNRLQYALHDPIHMLQRLGTGDRLNRYRERFDPDGSTFDPEAARSIVGMAATPREAGNRVNWNILKRHANEDALPVPIDALAEHADARRQATALIITNEATMDLLSERAMRPMLREQPALLLWLHNRVTSISAALRELNGRLSRAGRAANERESNVARRLLDTLGFVSQTYFVAVDSTAEAEALLREARTELGKPVAGMLVTGPTLTRVDVANLMAESRARRTSGPDRLYTHWYPSGDRVAYSNETWTRDGRAFFADPPLSVRGVEIAGRLYERAMRAGATPRAVESALYDLQYAMEQIDAVAERAALAALNELCSTTLSANEGKELFGVATNLAVRNLDHTYPKALLLRKAITDRLLASQPDRFASLVRDVFFDASESPNIAEFFDLTGFGDGSTGERATWEDVAASTRLGIVRLDATAISGQDRARLKRTYDRLERGFGTAAYFDSVMRLLVELKRKQSAAAA